MFKSDENLPFFMYLSFRAPHRPFSHNKTFEEPDDHLPYRSLGKPTEQIGIFDTYVGQIMKTLQGLDIADNTLIFFTSDNGPDQDSVAHFCNKKQDAWSEPLINSTCQI